VIEEQYNPTMGMPAGLRFAMVTTFYPPANFGGDGHAVRRLAHALARRGHEVHVIHDVDAFRSLTSKPDRAPLQEPEGVHVHALRSPLGMLSPLATQQLGRPLVHGREIRRILDGGFDVINFHNISLVGGPAILGYGTGIKLYTAHEHWLVCPSHILWRHNREVCTGRECFSCVLHYRRPPQLWRFGSLLEREARHVDEFLTMSEFAARNHAQFGFERPMRVIPAFLPDTLPIASRNVDASHARPYLLFVGRLEAIKGLQDIIPRFAGADGPELWIAGTGDYEPELRALSEGMPRVRFLGFQSEDQLRILYRDALAAVIPSICYEVFPLVVLEAFREGTPIIARDLGPFPEIIRASDGGLLFDTPEEFDRAVSVLSADPSRRDAMGRAAAAAFDRNWREEVAMERYFAVIREVAQRRGLHSVINRTQPGPYTPAARGAAWDTRPRARSLDL
jgi:glycosyltransferase involved in cell wall biosynthesis